MDTEKEMLSAMFPVGEFINPLRDLIEGFTNESLLRFGACRQDMTAREESVQRQDKMHEEMLNVLQKIAAGGLGGSQPDRQTIGRSLLEVRYFKI